jgi:(2Fe-2S) ferredoxin
MDRCELGANMLILPDNVMLSGVTADDLEPLLERLIAEIEQG